MRRLSLNRSEPAKKSGQNIPKNHCRTTMAERMVETLAELPFIGDQADPLSLSHPPDTAAKAMLRSRAAGSGPLFPGSSPTDRQSMTKVVLVRSRSRGKNLARTVPWARRLGLDGRRQAAGRSDGATNPAKLETRSPVQQPHAPLYCPYYSHREAIRSDPNTAPGTERHRLRPMAEIDARRG